MRLNRGSGVSGLAGVREVLPEGLRALEPAPAENTVAVVVTRPTAVEHGLDDLEDLGPVCDELALGADPDFSERSYGPEGLAEAYECAPGRLVPFPAPEERVVPVAAEALPAAAMDVVDGVSAGIETSDLVLMTRMTTAADPYTPEEAARYWLEGGDGT